MFGKSNENRESDHQDALVANKDDIPAPCPNANKEGEKDERQQKLKKRVSFADGSAPGRALDDEDRPFLYEHKEAMLVLVGLGLVAAIGNLAFRRRSP